MSDKKKLKKVLLIVLCVIGVIVLAVASYAIYYFASYNRLPDNLELTPENAINGEAKTGVTYKVMSYNIGFAAYTPDFGFFMDGGTKGQANSKESVEEVMKGIADFVLSEDPDFCLVEEVDFHSTRSHYVDEREYLKGRLSGYTNVFAQNWDNPYLIYPFFSPHGTAKTGIMTFSRFGITSSVRRSLPVEDSIMKIVDLDRCYTVSRVKVEGGKELVIFTTHLSAYTSDGKIADAQLEMLLDDMQDEYEKGNYVICGGDFNKDLLGNSAEIFGRSAGEYTWAQPIKASLFEGKNLSVVVPFDEVNPVPSCRNADGPYNENQFVVTVDGFIVSDNVTVETSKVYDTGFEYSDHNPVYMTIKLNP